MCPGEENCNDFLGAKGKDREAKEQNACIRGKCPLFSSKINREKEERTEKKLEAILYDAVILRRKRLSGFDISNLFITATVRDVLLELDAHFEANERETHLETNQLLEILISKPIM